MGSLKLNPKICPRKPLVTKKRGSSGVANIENPDFIIVFQVQGLITTKKLKKVKINHNTAKKLKTKVRKTFDGARGYQILRKAKISTEKSTSDNRWYQ